MEHSVQHTVSLNINCYFYLHGCKILSFVPLHMTGSTYTHSDINIFNEKSLKAILTGYKIFQFLREYVYVCLCGGVSHPTRFSVTHLVFV